MRGSNCDFGSLSYLSQVRQLRRLGMEALGRYDIHPKKVEFINHGENTTFRVFSEDRSSYLLRVHRPGYHTDEAILEELSWLNHLASQGFLVPNVMLSKRGKMLESVISSEVAQTRNVSVFRWVSGRFVGKRVSEKHMYSLGRLLAGFHSSGYKNTIQHRLYWDASGLVGESPKFGKIDNLDDVSVSDQSVITKLRHQIHKKLMEYQILFPERMGMIHADLHFGNLVNTKDGLAAIDFDDSGFGYFVYDLAIPYMSATSMFASADSETLAKIQKKFKSALFLGYRSLRPLDSHDEELFEVLVMARRILMLGWLNSRSDNPDLKKRLQGAVKRVMTEIQQWSL